MAGNKTRREGLDVGAHGPGITMEGR